MVCCSMGHSAHKVRDCPADCHIVPQKLSEMVTEAMKEAHERSVTVILPSCVQLEGVSLLDVCPYQPLSYEQTASAS